MEGRLCKFQPAKEEAWTQGERWEPEGEERDQAAQAAVSFKKKQTSVYKTPVSEQEESGHS